MLLRRPARLAVFLLPAALLAQEHPGISDPATAGAPLQIDAVLAEIRASNLQLRAARTRVEAARVDAPVISVLVVAVPGYDEAARGIHGHAGVRL